MNKLNLSPILAATVAATVCTNPNQASAQGIVVNYTNASPISFSGVGNDTVSIFPDIINADELLSINDGSISGGESGTFTLSVQYADSSTHQIFSGSFSSLGPSPFALTNLPAESFPTGDIAGLVFNLANFGFGTPQLTIPAGTVISFQGVPEPAAGALLVLGVAGAWRFIRRKAS